MAAVIRMKRHISDEPCTEDFVLNCKRKKLNESVKLSFAGTISKNADISEHISKISKTEAKEIILKKHNPGQARTLAGRMANTKEKSQNNRFKIVNYTRALEESTDENKLTIVDVEKEPSNEASTSIQSILPDNAADSFVYDLYISEANEMEYPEDINDLSVLEYPDYLYACPRAVDLEEESDISENSNDEDNWRNDYPEESDDESIGENKMRRAMGDLDFGNELSSDSEDESERLSNDFVHTIDSEAVGFEDDIDSCDVDRFGTAYASYKARVIKKMNLSGNEKKHKPIHNDDNSSDNDSIDESNKNYYYD